MERSSRSRARPCFAARRIPRDPHAFFGIDRRAIVTEPGETVEIDQLRDLFLAEAVLRDRQNPISKAG